MYSVKYALPNVLIHLQSKPATSEVSKHVTVCSYLC